nr:MAG TPA: minor tail protein [Caudoviricetes sp.]
MVSRKRGDTMADGSVIIDIKGDSSAFQKTLGGLGSLAGGALKGVGTAVGAATAAVGGLAAAAIKVGSGFESSMSQVAATMGITTDEIANGSADFELLSQAAKDAGATTAFSASQAAEALNYLALAGYDAQTAADALPAVLNLAAAGGMDLAYASDLATDAMAALGIEASNENLTKFGDQMAKTASKANTSVAQLGEAILTVGGTAKSLAGGTVELNAALGVLANRGIKGAEGGTALRNVILSLSAPTDKAADAMNSLGLNVYDAAGNMRPLNEVFKDLNNSMANMTEGEKTKVLSEIFNKVDLKSAQALLAGCGDEFDNLADAIANSGGAMQDMADTQLDNLQGDITILQSGLEGLGIAAYESMNGPLRESVQLATSMVGEISDAFSEGGITAAVGAVGDALAQMVSYIAGLAPQMINAGVQLLTSLVTGIQSNLPALVTSALGIVNALVNGIATVLPLLATTAVQIITALANGLGTALPTLLPIAAQAINELVQGLVANIPTLVASAGTLLNGFIEGVLAVLPTLVEAAITLIEGLAEGLIAAIPVLVAAVPTIIDGLVSVLVSAVPQIVQAGITLLVALIQALPTIISTITAALPQIITAVVSTLVSNAPQIASAGVQLLVALVRNLPTIISTIVAAVPQIVSAIVSAFRGLMGSITSIGVQIAQGVWQGISSMAGWLRSKVSSFFSGIVNSVKGLLKIHSPSKVFAEIGKFTMLGFAAGMEKTQDTVLKTAERLNNALVKQEEDLQQQLTDMEVAATKRKEAESEKAYQDSLNEKYAKLKKASKENEQQILNEIAELKEKHAKEQLEKDEANQKTALQTQLKAVQKYRDEYEKALDEIEKRQDKFAEKLADYGDLFEKTSGKLGNSFKIRDLQDDIDQINAFGDALQALKERDIPEELLSGIADMSLDDGLAYSQKLLQMTEEQYNAYIVKWQEKQAAAQRVAAQFYQDQRTTLQNDFIDRLPEDLGVLTDQLEDVGVDAMMGFNEGLAEAGKTAIATARSIANAIIREMQRAMDIHSPSRKMRDLVGVPTAQGFIVGFEGELDGWGRKMQNAVAAETGKISVAAAAQSEGRAAAGGVTREVHNSTKTVEKVARIEGDGVTGELVRMLGLRLKEEDNRVGDTLED